MTTAILRSIDDISSRPLRFDEEDELGLESADVVLPRFRSREIPAENSLEAIEANSTAFGGEELLEVSPLIRLHARPSERRFKVLQEWEGTISEITGGTFWARLVDITDANAEPQIVELPMDDIDRSDRALIVPGGVFYWSIGYDDKPSGRLRVSEIRMRRFPVWSSSVLESVFIEANELRRQWCANDTIEPSTGS